MLNSCTGTAAVQEQWPLLFDTAAQTTPLMKFPEENSIEEILTFKCLLELVPSVLVTWQATEGSLWQLKNRGVAEARDEAFP